MTPDESLQTKQIVVFLNFNYNFSPTVAVLKKIIKEPRNMTNDRFRLFLFSTKTTENNIAAKINIIRYDAMWTRKQRRTHEVKYSYIHTVKAISFSLKLPCSIFT